MVASIKKEVFLVKKLCVRLGSKSYNIHFNDSFDGLVCALKEINAPEKMLIVTDTNVEKLYANEVNSILKSAGYDTAVFSFSAGEENKGMDTVLSICNALMEYQMDRKSMILALGGGVVGDMAGFAAAIYMRGISFVQVPTTLLSQSDSSVGGKTGVDFSNAKNILGAFHQPKMVYINVSTLKTLPQKEFISGMGEVIKHSVIRDSEFFEYLHNNADKVKKSECDILLQMAYKNCSIKAEVVSRDEFENGLRADLNFGHTFGHAIESYFNFTLTHGECVALGMVAASYIAKSRGEFPEEDFYKLENILKLYGFKIRINLDNKKAIKELMLKDKKKSGNELRFILPEKTGAVIQTYDVTTAQIDDALDYLSDC